MMRQIGKQMLTILAWMVLASLARAESLVTTVVTDPLTGIAMDGYDPVSYFTDPDPQEGKPDFEYVWQGVPWYFESAANRDVFQRSPEVYAPQFGGHCPMSLSRGYLSDGKPRLYAIHALKLYFFYSTANRDAFMLAQSEAISGANANWPKLSGLLMGAQAAEPAADAIAAGTESSAIDPAAASAGASEASSAPAASSAEAAPASH